MSQDYHQYLKKLIDAGDWSSVRDFLEESDEESLSLNKVICFLLNNADDFPLDVLELMFAYSRWENRCKFSSKIRDQILRGICGGFDYRIKLLEWRRLEVLDLILKEHSNRYQNYIEIDWESVHELTGYAWRTNFFYIDRSRTKVTWLVMKQNVEERLLLIQSVDDFRKESNQDIFDLWERTIRFIRYGRPDTAPLLHCAVMVKCPLFIVWLIAKLYPDQLRQRDGEGCIPLHYAWNRPSNIQNNWKFGFSTKFLEQSGIKDMFPDSYVEFLLDRHSQGAKYVDNKGEFPLTQYLYQKPASTENDKPKSVVVDVTNLIKAAPMVLTTPGNPSQLLPFMIPSSREAEHIKFKKKIEAERQFAYAMRNRRRDAEPNFLSLTYELLKEDPSCLNIAIDPDLSLESLQVQRLRKDMTTLAKGTSDTIKKQREEIVNQKEEIQRLRLALEEEKKKNKSTVQVDADEPSPDKKRMRLV